MPHSERPTSGELRVALVCPYSLSRPGGVQGQVVGLARALDSRGGKVTVFAPLDGDGDAPTDIDLIPSGHSVSLPANGSIAPVTVSLRAVLAARKMLTTGGFDVVHVHEPFTPGLPYGLLLGGGVPPMVVTFHRSGSSFFYKALRPLARRLAAKFVVRCAVSEAARATASRALGGTFHVGFNGVEIDAYRDVEAWPSDRPTILFLGRHEERKGLSFLLDAFSRMEGRSPGQPATGGPDRARLWIAGDGPETERLRRRYPESEDIEWLGVLSEADKVRRLVGADVVSAPSLGGESFGMVLLEAMAAKTVVVASDIEGYRDAARGHAVLVPPGDAAALAAALDAVLEGRAALGVPGPDGAAGGSTSQRDRWLEGAAQRAGEFSMDRLAAWYEGHYRAAVVRPGG